MSRFDHRHAGSERGSEQTSGVAPGRRTLTMGVAAVQRQADVNAGAGAGAGASVDPVRDAVQRRLLDDALRPDLAGDVHGAAAHGVSGTGGALPFADVIQPLFGRHDVSGIEAHQDGAAREGAQKMGAAAFATGHHVAFAGAPDLHIAAHEAAHVVQQRGGVQLLGGVGESDDRYERHADAVADAVVRGESAEALLDPFAGGDGGTGGAVQRKVTFEAIEEKNLKELAQQAWETAMKSSKELQILHQDSEVLVSITIDEVDESDDRGDTKVTHREDKGRLIILINLFKTPEDQLDNLAQTLLHEGTLHAFAAWERFQDVKKGTLKSKDAFPTNKKQLVAQEDHEHRDEQKWALVLKASQGSRVEYEQTLFEIMTHIPKTELGIFAVNEIVRLNPENKDNSGSEEEDEK